MNIAITGFYGTGSSAVMDLLMEYEGVSCAIGKRYEHYPFLLRNCIFDLENRLFSPNSNYMIISCALTSFYEEMKRQNDNDFGWFGSYKALYKDKFMKLVDTFMNEICEEYPERKNISYYKKVKFSPFKCILQIGAKLLKGYKITKLGRVYCYDSKPKRFLTVTHEQFLEKARNFINGYFELIKTDSTMLYDHLLLPEQCGIVDKFFDDDFRLIVVDRDPRDVYISSKYIWSQVKFGGQKAPFPDTIESFCRHWEFMHQNLKDLKPENKKKILHIYFEDLVYNYEETIKTIEEFCGLKSTDHTKKLQIFEPSKSIHNTQVFDMKEQYIPDVNILDKNLKGFYYKFPFKVENHDDQIFDN